MACLKQKLERLFIFCDVLNTLTLKVTGKTMQLIIVKALKGAALCSDTYIAA